MPTNVCISAFPQGWEAVVELAKAAERAGMSDFGVADSPLIARDLYVSCAACLLETSNLRVQTAVTNPVTRHPSVTAGSVLSMAELGPGRVAIGIATGDSAVWGAGLKPAKIAHMCEYIVALKTLLRGEPATYQGATFSGHWPDFDPALAPPVYVACSGPRVLKASAQVADGLIIAEMGYMPENIAHVRALIAEGCAEVDRDPEELDLWWLAEFRFADDAEAAAAACVGASQWLITGSTRGKGIPEGFVPKLRELHADTHTLATYSARDRSEMLAARAKRLGLYDWLLERSARLYGTADDIGARMDELRELGIENWYLWPDGEMNIVESMERLGEVINR